MEYHLTDEITVSTGLIGPIGEQVGTPRVTFRVPGRHLNLNPSIFLILQKHMQILGFGTFA